MTAHSNLTVQFSDLSAHLLVGIPPDPLQQHFPQQLHDLTIDMNRALLDPVLSKRITPELTSHPVIQSIHLAPETLECIVVFKSGEIFVYRLSHSAGTDSRETHDAEILMLDYLVPLEKSRYSPFCMINAGKGAVTASAICDIGGYSYHNLLICRAYLLQDSLRLPMSINHYLLSTSEGPA